MLKIREEIDLKELEKFNFRYDNRTGRYRFCERNIDGATYIYINVWNRRIIFRQDKETDTWCLTKLYDLITAGLVEKC